MRHQETADQTEPVTEEVSPPPSEAGCDACWRKVGEAKDREMALQGCLDAAHDRIDLLRGLLERIVGTLQYADFTLTGERVFSELDVYLDQARDALKVSGLERPKVQP